MRNVERRAAATYRDHFGTEPQVLASAPGRVNLIGEHTDYNDGFVLPFAIELRIAVAMGIGDGGLYSANFDELRPAGEEKDGSWADYPRGVMWSLRNAGYDIPPIQGSFSGDVPRGSGLSSSAAIESATALALDTLFALGISRKELAILCRRAENDFVGVSSGIMDQMASLLAEQGSALLIDCRSLDWRLVPLDLRQSELTLLVCDTRMERTLAASGYNDRRATCRRATQALGLVSLRDARLEDVGRLAGEEKKRARHVVTENLRVLEAVQALEQGDFVTLGRLMYASHGSLRDDYDVSTPELDAFVEIGAQTGALGARLTGAGFGGCAIALVPESAVQALISAVRERYNRSIFKQPRFYRFEPSPGAQLMR